MSLAGTVCRLWLGWKKHEHSKILSELREKNPGHKHVTKYSQLSYLLRLNIKWWKSNLVSPRNQDKLYVKNLHGGGRADNGYYTHTPLCVFQVHLESELCGRALGCSPCQDLKPFHCLPEPSRTTPAWKKPPKVSTADKPFSVWIHVLYLSAEIQKHGKDSWKCTHCILLILVKRRTL